MAATVGREEIASPAVKEVLPVRVGWKPAFPIQRAKAVTAVKVATSGPEPEGSGGILLALHIQERPHPAKTTP
jgi:hypothetical protein